MTTKQALKNIFLVCSLLNTVAWSQSAWVLNDNLLNLSSVGNTGGYGTLYQGGFRSVSDYGVDGVFLPTPNGNGSLLSTTGIYYRFDTSLVSTSPWGETARSQWQNNPNATMEGETASLNSYFTPKGINWAANSLFAGSNAGITYDLFEIGQSLGKSFSKFTTYFGNHTDVGGGEWFSGNASYAVLVDGVLVSSGTGFTAENPFTNLLEVNLTETSRFLTLVVGDGGGIGAYDHGVYVAPTLTTVPEPTSISLLALGGLALAINKRRRA
ncbi:MAG TPA: hypothetical protein DCP55_04265 [Chitinophagaceae bacterium]|jgi:hypothetical protein|nr:PEP-CTERM sorting domain-containing protein [Pseudomonadota bacterium]HAL95166.1 hypothetical protein [Chitinophagaceae bacterium]